MICSLTSLRTMTAHGSNHDIPTWSIDHTGSIGMTIPSDFLCLSRKAKELIALLSTQILGIEPRSEALPLSYICYQHVIDMQSYQPI